MLYTGLNWNDVITGETTALHTRSLVHNSLVFGNVFRLGLCNMQKQILKIMVLGTVLLQKQFLTIWIQEIG